MRPSHFQHIAAYYWHVVLVTSPFVKTHREQLDLALVRAYARSYALDSQDKLPNARRGRVDGNRHMGVGEHRVR